MLEIEEDGEEESGREESLLEDAPDRVEEEPEEESVVLEVDVVHNDQPGIGQGQEEDLAVDRVLGRGFLGPAPELGHALVAGPGADGQHEIAQDHGEPLEDNGLDGIVVQVRDLEHGRVEVDGDVGPVSYTHLTLPTIYPV